MIKPDFKPKNDLNLYLNDKFNYDLYSYLLKKEYLIEYANLFDYHEFPEIDILNFFNHLYFHFETIKLNHKTPLVFNDYYKTVDLPGSELMLLFDYLTKLIDYSRYKELNVCYEIFKRNRELVGEKLGVWELCDEDYDLISAPKVRIDKQYNPDTSIESDKEMGHQHNSAEKDLSGNSKSKTIEQKTTIKYDDYHDFTANLFYRDPLEKSPLSYISKWADDFKYLRKEILENLINLSPEKKKPYLEFLLVDLEHFLSSNPEKEQLMHEYYHKFNTSEEEVLKNLNFDNPLFVALMFSHDSLSNRPDFELKDDVRNIQNTFYFIHLNRAVKEAIDFIKDQLARIDPQAGIKPIKHPPPINTIKEYTFENFVTPDKQAFIIALLEDLSISRDGVSILSARRKSALRGVVLALKESNILPDWNNIILIKIIAAEIGLEISSKLDNSHTSDDYKVKAEKYIKAHYRS